MQDSNRKKYYDSLLPETRKKKTFLESVLEIFIIAIIAAIASLALTIMILYHHFEFIPFGMFDTPDPRQFLQLVGILFSVIFVIVMFIFLKK